MDRAEAIGVLEQEQRYLMGGAMPNMQEYDEAIDMAIAALREQEQSKWISVDERLPKESGEYLVVSVNGHIAVLDYSTVHKAFNAYDDISCANHAISCTHWMPLPTPTKEGAEG